MIFPDKYNCLNENEFSTGEFTLVPIRYKDRISIMQWRNEQIYHLRQSELLTVEKQDWYFKEVVAKLFQQKKPTQILFSLLKNGNCIGYGGLVHINWIDRNAEISFIMDTKLENNSFHQIWKTFLELIEQVAFNELKLHKIYTYAFDLRPHLYQVVESAGFIKEAELKEHCIFEGKAISVIIHSKLNINLNLEKATDENCKLTYSWANNPEIRKHSFNQDSIPYENHQQWFLQKIKSPNCLYFILKKGVDSLGSIRVDLTDNLNSGTISYLIDTSHQKKGYGKEIILHLEKYLIANNLKLKLIAYVKPENIGSIKIFNKLGYEESKEENCLRFEKQLV